MFSEVSFFLTVGLSIRNKNACELMTASCYMLYNTMRISSIYISWMSGLVSPEINSSMFLDIARKDNAYSDFWTTCYM